MTAVAPADLSIGRVRGVAAGVARLDARLRGVPEDVPFLLEAATLEGGDHFTFATRAGNLDCLGTPAGSGGFDVLRRAAQEMDEGGVVIAVAALPDLIAMKLAAGRPKDHIEVEILRALQDEMGGKPEAR